MMLTVGFVVLAAFVSTMVTYVVCRARARAHIGLLERQAADQAAAIIKIQAEFEARRDEMRRASADASTREAEAKRELQESDRRVNQLSEDKGRLQTEAGRVQELKANLAQRETELSAANTRIEGLETAKTAALKDAEASEQRATALIAKERETSAAVIRAKDEQINKLNDFIVAAREVMGTEFKALSSDVLKAASDQLLKATDGILKKHGDQATEDDKIQQQRIEGMLKPVEDSIKRLDKHVEDSNLARSKAEALLDDQVRRLAGATDVLTNALRKPVIRGSWGEMQLENALENAGLEPELDYILQHSTDAEDGRKRTDAIINLPKGRKLIIDSKNLMESYFAYVAAEEPAQKAILADTHSKSLRTHIKALSAKEYWRRYEGLDCVILFIPHDGMYHAAIRDESELIREASDRRVFIANPMSLIPLLKAIRYVLDQDRLNKSAEEISTVGAELYGEITRFADNMATIGERIKSTVRAYNDALPGLDRYIVSKSRKLKQLGSAKGDEASIPDAIELQPKLFSSRELKHESNDEEPHLLQDGRNNA